MKRKLIYVVIPLLLTGLTLYGQETYTIDGAIRDSVSKLTKKLLQNPKFPPETSVSIVNFSAPLKVSNYAIEELRSSIVNDTELVLVERDENSMEQVRQESDFQLSGEVSDESARSIGKKRGAQVIIRGSFTPLDSRRWRMTIRVLSVEEATVPWEDTYTIKDPLLSRLIPKSAGRKLGTGALNIFFGLGSYLERDIAGGLTITAGFAAAAGLFAVEAAALDWDSPAVGLPAAIGAAAAGLSIVYGFIRPFIFNRNPKLAAFLDNTRIDALPVSGGTSAGGKNNRSQIGIRLAYTVHF